MAGGLSGWANWPLLIAGVFASLLPVGGARAIELSREGDMIVLSGAIKPGDAKIFQAFVEREYKPFRESDDSLGASWSVALNSPGGSLADGIEIGRIMHANALVSYVRRDDVCYSACAIAFLGGVFQYVTGVGPVRKMDVGATLGFHGYRLDENRVVIMNEAFDQARALNGLVLEYAAEMRDIDLGFLAELLNVPASSIRLINTPADLKKLRITLEEPLPKRPKNAGYHICYQAVRKLLPALEDVADDRLERKPVIIGDVRALMKRLTGDLTWDEADSQRKLTALLATMPVKDGLDLLAGRNLYLDQIKWPVERYPLGRGGGFYYDQCYVFFDTVGNGATSAAVTGQASWVWTQHGPLDFFPPNEPLWK